MLTVDRQKALDSIRATLGDMSPGVALSYQEHVLDNLVAVTSPDGAVEGYNLDMALYYIYMRVAADMSQGGGMVSFTSEGSSVTKQQSDPAFFERLANWYRNRAVDGGGSSIHVAAVAETPGAGLYSDAFTGLVEDAVRTRWEVEAVEHAHRLGY